ncbi:MAG: hypothetical protein DLM70_07870, partial [Chloroflexi bacterium]
TVYRRLDGKIGRVLDGFIRLPSEKAGQAEAVLAYARRYGVLGICRHVYIDEPDTVMRWQCESCRADPNLREPVGLWLDVARRLRSILLVGAALKMAQPQEQLDRIEDVVRALFGEEARRLDWPTDEDIPEDLRPYVVRARAQHDQFKKFRPKLIEVQRRLAWQAGLWLDAVSSSLRLRGIDLERRLGEFAMPRVDALGALPCLVLGLQAVLASPSGPLLCVVCHEPFGFGEDDTLKRPRRDKLTCSPGCHEERRKQAKHDTWRRTHPVQRTSKRDRADPEAAPTL